MLPAWIYVVVIGVCANAYTFSKLYKTASSRAALVASGESNPALLFLYGRLNGTSVGALTAWRYGVWGALFAALMSVFIVIRHTRADEEAGRLELIGSAAVGRQAPLASALAVATLANVVLTVGAVRGAAAHRAARRGIGRAGAGDRHLRAGLHRDQRGRRPAHVGRAGRARPGVRRARRRVPRPGGRRLGRGRRAGLAHLGAAARLDGDAAAVRRGTLVGAGAAARAVRRLHLAGLRARRTPRPRRGTAARPAGQACGIGAAARPVRRSRGACSGRRSRAGRPGTRSSSRSAARPPRESARWSARAARCGTSSPGSAASRRSSTPTCPR